MLRCGISSCLAPVALPNRTRYQGPPNAVGKAGLITGDMLKPGAALIDIDINQVTLAGGGTIVVGDADFASCVEAAGWITPAPGGVGPVTVATLMRNAVTAARLQHDAYRAMVEERPE